MKYIGQRVVRGFVENETEARINVFDGDYTTGYKITKFVIIVVDPDNSGQDGFGTLGYEPNVGTQWRLKDANQFGWASMYNSGNATGPTAQPFNQVDRNNLIIEDFYIYGEMHAGGEGVNYYIEMDKYQLEPMQGTLSMVNNRSQG